MKKIIPIVLIVLIGGLVGFKVYQQKHPEKYPEVKEVTVVTPTTQPTTTATAPETSVQIVTDVPINGTLKGVIEVGAIKTETQKALSTLASKAQAAKEEHIRESKKNTSQVFLKVIQNKVALYDQQFKTLEPKLQYINTQYNELVKLHENWVADAEIVNQTLTAKEQEYELMKSLSKASDSAGAFLKRDSPEMKNFNESLKQIDKSIFTYTSNVENFQRTVLPTLRSMDSQREANEEEGLKIIEEYKKQRIAI